MRIPRYIVRRPAEPWNRLYGLAYAALEPGAHASFASENLPDWLIDKCVCVGVHEKTQLKLFQSSVELNQVPQSWFLEQQQEFSAQGDTVTFEIAEFSTEWDILALFPEESPLEISQIRRCPFTRDKTESQQLAEYRRRYELRLIAMVTNYYPALDDLSGVRSHAIPTFRNWQTNMSKRHQPHLWDGDNPIRSTILPLPTQIIDPSTTDGLKKMLAKLSALN